MSYRTGFEILETGDMATTRVFKSFEASKNSIITQIVTGIYLNDASAFTGLVAKIYSDNAGSPGVLIGTSTNSWGRDVLFAGVGAPTDDYGVIWAYYNFNNIVIRQGLTYHLVLNGASGYTADPSSTGGNSYIGWRIGYPDNIYEDLTFEDQNKWYFDVAYLGKRL